MAGLNALMVLLTIGVKAVRTARLAWYKRHFKRIEPALENYVITGEDQPELDALRPWQRDLFASRLIAEHIVLMRGSGKEHLVRLADHLGLVDHYLKGLGTRRRWRRTRPTHGPRSNYGRGYEATATPGEGHAGRGDRRVLQEMLEEAGEP
jgi:hypothetical protein